ncbi:MAG: site-2 protease family protein [Nanoarchaeota archaeon]|nr:site-2 protease family protein [Nanoarchaeota archaeon]MBU4242526.1 site-2 protease family protein [Nanoarchaeota archaeon]MBU4351650.1 site-2 protease family protein [Nanoarchaeota archaeon]
MDKSSIHLGKIFGVEVNLHFTWFLIVLLLAWSLAASYFPVQYPDLTKINYWVLGIIAAVLLFASVLFHEMSHSLTAKYFNIKVDSITLFFFGGVAQLKEDKFTPKKEFWVSIAGPIASLSLAGIFFLVAYLVPSLYFEAIASYLARLNLILGLFNLVPGFPLDGGRIFRAVLWQKTKNLQKATYIAAETGKAFAIFMIIFGIAGMLFGGMGLWYVLLGIFLYTLSKETYKQTILKIVLEKVKVKEVVNKKFKSFSLDTNISRINIKSLLKYQQDYFPVVKGKKILGVVSYIKLTKFQQFVKTVKIQKIMISIKKIKVLGLDEDCYSAVRKIMRQKMGVLPVVDKGNLIGILNGNSLVSLMDLESQKKK